MDLNIVEKSVKKRIEEHYKRTRIMTIGRVANLTVPLKAAVIASTETYVAVVARLVLISVHNLQLYLLQKRQEG